MLSKDYLHVSVDTETIGLDSRAGIVQIALAASDGNHFPEFSIAPNQYITGKHKDKFSYDLNTIHWHDTTNPKYLEALDEFGGEARAEMVKFVEYLEHLEEWAKQNGYTKVLYWFKSKEFDIPKIMHAYEQLNIAPPRAMNFRDCHEIRTLELISGITCPTAKHTALADAELQVNFVVGALELCEP